MNGYIKKLNFNMINYSQDVIDHNGLSWVNEDLGLVYLGVPKTASTSIRSILGPNKKTVNLNNYDTKHTIFTIIREPIDRFVSGYLESLKRTDVFVPQYLRNMTNTEEQLKTFVNELKKHFFEVHTTPQSYFLTSLKGIDFNFDYILRFENIQDDYNKMSDDIGLNLNLTHLNRNNMNKEVIRNIIENDKELKDSIVTLYKDDFILYDKYFK